MERTGLPALAAGFAISCVLATGGQAQSNETSVYLGLNFTLDEPDFDPRIAVGVQRLFANADGRVIGADLGLRLDPRLNMRIEDIRLSAVAGDQRAQIGVGVGYALQRQTSFTTMSLQALSARIGVDSRQDPQGPTFWAELLPLRLSNRDGN